MNMKKVALITIVSIGILGVIMYVYSNSIQDRGKFMQNDQPTGGPVRRDSIIFHTLFCSSDYINNNDGTLVLYFENYTAGGVAPHANQLLTVMQYDINSITSLYEAIKSVKSNSEISIEFVRESYIVISTDIHNLRYVMISTSLLTSGTANNRVFGYMPMQGRFSNQNPPFDNFGPIKDMGFEIYIPYHLFDDHLLFHLYDSKNGDRNHELSHQIGHYYRIYGDITDFKAFYESLNLYEIEYSDSYLVLEGQIYMREKRNFSTSLSCINGRIIMSFAEINGQRYVAYSFQTK